MALLLINRGHCFNFYKKSEMSSLCAGCRRKPPNRQYLTCSQCNCVYDLECANVSSKLFNNVMSPDRKKNWKWPSCKCKMPKTGNLDTPVRSIDQNPTQKHDNSPESNNITLRKRTVTKKKKRYIVFGRHKYIIRRYHMLWKNRRKHYSWCLC